MKVYRGYQVKPNPRIPSSYSVSVDGIGGSVPSVLDGMYTSTTLAIQAIDRYLDNKVEDEDGKPNKARKQSGV